MDEVSRRTLEHYDQRAEEFWRGTRDHDVRQNVAALLKAIEGSPPFSILDFGCGPGRDLKTFAGLGHIAVGLEGSALGRRMRARQLLRVLEQDFLRLDLPGRALRRIPKLRCSMAGGTCRACCASCTRR